MQVIKRNGSIVDFDPTKIKVAIEKANAEVNEKEKAKKNEIKEIISYIENLDKKRILVEDIQDIVEEKLMEYGLGIVYEDGRFVYNEIQPDSMPDNFIKEIVVEDGIFKGKYQDYRYIEIKKGVMLEILMDGTPISLFLKTDILPSSQEELNNIIHKVLINN